MLNSCPNEFGIEVLMNVIHYVIIPSSDTNWHAERKLQRLARSLWHMKIRSSTSKIISALLSCNGSWSGHLRIEGWCKDDSVCAQVPRFWWTGLRFGSYEILDHFDDDLDAIYLSFGRNGYDLDRIRWSLQRSSMKKREGSYPLWSSSC